MSQPEYFGDVGARKKTVHMVIYKPSNSLDWCVEIISSQNEAANVSQVYRFNGTRINAVVYTTHEFTRAEALEITRRILYGERVVQWTINLND